MESNYYSRVYIGHLIRESVEKREVALLGKNNANMRALRINCLFDLDRILRVSGWKRNKQNMYRSVATLKEDIPSFTFNVKKRSAETSVWFKNEYPKLISKYDLFFDFDKSTEDSWEDLIKEVKILKEYLDEYKVPYYLLFSGNKGFQIIVPGDYLPINKIENGNLFPHKTIVEKIKQMLNLNFLDLANNGVGSRLMKIPYSLVSNGIEDEQEMNMALPLSDVQFEHFRIENMKVKNILSSTKLVRRGTLERFQNLGLEEKKENLQNFLNLFAFK